MANDVEPLSTHVSSFMMYLFKSLRAFQTLKIYDVLDLLFEQKPLQTGSDVCF